MVKLLYLGIRFFSHVLDILQKHADQSLSVLWGDVGVNKESGNDCSSIVGNTADDCEIQKSHHDVVARTPCQKAGKSRGNGLWSKITMQNREPTSADLVFFVCLRLMTFGLV